MCVAVCVCVCVCVCVFVFVCMCVCVCVCVCVCFICDCDSVCAHARIARACANESVYGLHHKSSFHSLISQATDQHDSMSHTKPKNEKGQQYNHHAKQSSALVSDGRFQPMTITARKNSRQACGLSVADLSQEIMLNIILNIILLNKTGNIELGTYNDFT